MEKLLRPDRYLSRNLNLLFTPFAGWDLRELFLILCVGLAGLTTNASNPLPAPTVTEAVWLKIGENHQLGNPSRLVIENRDIIEGIDRGGSISIRGKALGSSWIHTAQKSFQVHVVSYAQWRQKKCIDTALQKALGLRAEAKGGRIQIEGQLHRFHEWKHLRESCPASKTWRPAFKISSALRSEVSQQFQRELSEAGLPQLPLRWEPELALLHTSGAALPSKMKNWVEAWGLDLVTEANLVEVAPQVHVQLLIAEVKSDFSRQLGVEWSPDYRAQILGDSEEKLAGLFVQANFLEANGLGQTLARPELLARSGQSAEFWAGGEFPVVLIGRHSKEVQWKKYGILLKVKPSADLFGRMNIKIDAEVSSIDMGTAVSGVPGISINRVQTDVDLLKTQTIALSGLVRQIDGEKYQGLPGLASIPVLGKLFGSEDFRKSRSELVILVRPQIRDSKTAQWK